MELIGEYEGSGFKEPPSLVRRADGQIIQLTELLYLVAKHCDGERDVKAVASLVSEEYGKTVSGDNVRKLIDDKLRPLGVLCLADGTSPKLERPDPLLALKFRKAIIPETASQSVALLFKPLFWPPVVLVALAGLVAFDVWLFIEHGVAQSFRDALYDPALLLLVLGMVIVSAGWHEFGHAAGCAYGGACPGAMGAGIYVAYPAFYTDVTDSYRLDRRGRLRTDLAGVYFNGLFILATAGIYGLTGWEPLLLVILIQHIEVAHQLLPFLRLDGYYIIADWTGVPDMFARIKPILASVLKPWKKPDERVRQLKPWVRIVVTVWVLLVIPLLLFQLGMLLLHAPRIFATAWDSLGQQWQAVTDGFGGGDVVQGVGGLAQAAILVLPLVGIVYTFARLFVRILRGGWRNTDGRPVLRVGFVGLMAAVVAGLAFVWLPNGDYEPIRRGERGTLSEGVAAARRAGSGRSSLESRERAAARGELDAGDAEDTEGDDPQPTTTSTTVRTPTTLSRRSAATTTTLVRRTTTTADDDDVTPTTTE